jgi:hypothetical protein
LADRRLKALTEVGKRAGESRAQRAIWDDDCQGVWHCKLHG